MLKKISEKLILYHPNFSREKLIEELLDFASKWSSLRKSLSDEYIREDHKMPIESDAQDVQEDVLDDDDLDENEKLNCSKEKT